MLRIALDLRRTSILNRDQNPTSIRTIVWAGGMYDFLHKVVNYRKESSAAVGENRKSALPLIFLFLDGHGIDLIEDGDHQHYPGRYKEGANPPQQLGYGPDHRAA